MNKLVAFYITTIISLLNSNHLTAQSYYLTKHKLCQILESGEYINCTDYMPGSSIFEYCKINANVNVELKWANDDSLYKINWDKFSVTTYSEHKFIYSAQTSHLHNGKTTSYTVKLYLTQEKSILNLEAFLCIASNKNNQLVAIFLKP